jgi:fimbrial chaperone protein
VLTIKNTSQEALRFQLSISAWAQEVGGQLILAPTRDVILFPRLVVLPPGAQRLIRVGVVAAGGPIEKSYRLFVEELPPFDGDTPTATTPGVKVRVRVGIPVFIQPAGGRAEPRLAGLAAQGRRLSFELQNLGVVHVPPQRVRVTGYRSDGAVAWERDLESWYVLAKGTRRYETEVRPEECAITSAVGVEVETKPEALTGRLDPVPLACAR